MRRIGIYSGTFDPPHAGHVAFARGALFQCNLDMILFLPEPSPRGKHHVTEVVLRRHLLQSMISLEPLMNVHTSAERTFTVRSTLPALRTTFPNATFIFLIGSDVAIKLKQWEGLEQLLPHFEFAIGMRDTQSLHDVTQAMDEIKHVFNIPINYHVVTTTKSDEASSRYRF